MAAFAVLTPWSAAVAADYADSVTQTGSYVFDPAGDAFVSQRAPSKNFGESDVLRLDSRSPRKAYLRFDVEGLTGDVVSARLWMYSRDRSNRGLAVRTAASNNWREATITWRNAPSTSSVRAVSDSLRANRWKGVDVAHLVHGNGPVTFALTTKVNENDHALEQRGRRGGPGERPQRDRRQANDQDGPRHEETNCATQSHGYAGG